MPADPRCQIYEALGIDRKTIRKYVAPAIAEGLEPAPEEPFNEQLWRERIGRWFPEVIDPSVRALTWDRIAVHRDWIADQLKARVTAATIAQRLRDERGVEVSESTVRRYMATEFAQQHLEEKVPWLAAWSIPVAKRRSITASWGCGWTRRRGAGSRCGALRVIPIDVDSQQV